MIRDSGGEGNLVEKQGADEFSCTQVQKIDGEMLPIGLTMTYRNWMRRRQRCASGKSVASMPKVHQLCHAGFCNSGWSNTKMMQQRTSVQWRFFTGPPETSLSPPCRGDGKGKSSISLWLSGVASPKWQSTSGRLLLHSAATKMAPGVSECHDR